VVLGKSRDAGLGQVVVVEPDLGALTHHEMCPVHEGHGDRPFVLTECVRRELRPPAVAAGQLAGLHRDTHVVSVRGVLDGQIERLSQAPQMAFLSMVEVDSRV